MPPAELEAVQNALVTHKTHTLKEPGCITFKITQCETNPCRFDVYEEFTDRAAFDAHQARARQSGWGKVSENVERYYELIE